MAINKLVLSDRVSIKISIKDRPNDFGRLPVSHYILALWYPAITVPPSVNHR